MENTNTHHETLANRARQVMKAVLQIIVEGYDGNDIRSILNPSYKVPQNWTGSGFFVRNASGKIYILTNSHVVCNAEKIHVKSAITSDEVFSVKLSGLKQNNSNEVVVKFYSGAIAVFPFNEINSPLILGDSHEK